MVTKYQPNYATIKAIKFAWISGNLAQVSFLPSNSKKWVNYSPTQPGTPDAAPTGTSFWSRYIFGPIKELW